MSDMLHEEEQIIAIKEWFAEHGRKILAAVFLVVATVGTFEGVNRYQQHRAHTAAVIYSDLMQAMEDSTTDTSGKAKKTAQTLAQQLKSEYAGSMFANFAAFFLAKDAADVKNWEGAMAQLQWVMEQNPAPEIKLLTQLRMARVLMASQQLEKALALIEHVEAGGYTASYEELKGDLYLALKQADKARTAYGKALTSSQAGGEERPVLQMKLDNLAVNKE